MTHLVLLLAAVAQAAPAPADPRPPASELVARIRDTPVAELEKLSFLDLNVLKNAVFASTGYVFAEDRPWLRAIFCARGDATPAPAAAPGLSPAAYRFPECKEGGELGDAHRKALANLRVATFKRIARYETAGALDQAVTSDCHPLWSADFPLLSASASRELAPRWEASLRRDMAGLRRLRQLVDKPGGFDAMELLGLYAGDVLFLRTLIEAQHGKPLTGTLAWEAQQLLGVVEARSDYDPAKLPIEVQTKLQVLDDVIQKIQRSDVNDLPARLKGKRLDYKTPVQEEEDVTVYQGAAC